MIPTAHKVKWVRDNIINGDMPPFINSICPKGWKMATSEVESESNRKPLLNNGSFAYMLGKYGFEFNQKYAPNGTYYSNNAGLSRLAPIYFVYAGGMMITSLTGGGDILTIWGSSPYGRNNAYEATAISEDRLIAAWWSNRWGAYSLRLVVEKLETVAEITFCLEWSDQF